MNRINLIEQRWHVGSVISEWQASSYVAVVRVLSRIPLVVSMMLSEPVQDVTEYPDMMALNLTDLRFQI